MSTARCMAYTSVPYAALVSTFEKIEATTKRLEILGLLTQFLLVVAKRDTGADVKSSNLLKVVYLCINRVRIGPKTSLTAALPRLRRYGTRYRRVSSGQSNRREYGP